VLQFVSEFAAGKCAGNCVKLGEGASQATIALWCSANERSYQGFLLGVPALGGGTFTQNNGKSVDASRGRTRVSERLVAGFANAQVLEHRSRGAPSSLGHPLPVGIVDTSSKATRRLFCSGHRGCQPSDEEGRKA
jgi:hypothetical protein